MIVHTGGLPKAEKKITKHGPWLNFGMVLAAVYGPRLVMLWKLYQAERDRQKRRSLSVVPAREDPDSIPDADPGQVPN